jgi:hypothetical protein
LVEDPGALGMRTDTVLDDPGVRLKFEITSSRVVGILPSEIQRRRALGRAH